MTQIKLRRGSAAQWTSDNPTLGPAEPGVELDTGKFKFGDGVTPWNDLDYAAGEGGGGGVYIGPDKPTDHEKFPLWVKMETT